MIDVKQATEIARQHLIELLGKQELADEKGITLEEFELTDNGRHWNITLGYPIRETRPRQKLANEVMGHLLLDEPRRKFKTFRIQSKTEKLLAMKYLEQ